MTKKIEISQRTIVFTTFFLIALYLLFQIREIITFLFICLVLTFAFNPLVRRLQKLRLPRPLAILVIYFVFLGSLGLIIAGIVPPLVDQTKTLITRLPEYTRALGLPSFNNGTFSDQLDQLSFLSSNLLKLTVGVFNNLLNFFVLLVLTFYLLMERRNLDDYLLFLFGAARQERARKFVNRLEKKLGGWVRAQLALMVIVGLMSYVGLRLLGIDFALPLALVAGVLEIIPNIGPTISAIPAILAGLAISPLMGLAAGALYLLIQQIENSVIVPQIMAKGTGVKPLLAIIALIIGYRLAGVKGAILAIPVVILIQVVMGEFFVAKNLGDLRFTSKKA